MINVNEILLSNKGYIKIDGIELAEIKNIEIKLIPEYRTIKVLTSLTPGKIMVGCEGKISMEFYKIYSRFKPALLECYKRGIPFNFSLDCVSISVKEDGQESLYIDNCWFEGEVTLAQLKADGDILSERFEAGFTIETAKFESSGSLKDSIDWISL